MITKKQEEWLNHLTADDQITIIPYNPKVKKYLKMLNERYKPS